MFYPIYVYGASVLRKKAVEISKDDESLGQLIDDMFETMYHSDGIGLAAPQIGKSLRLFVIDASNLEDEDNEGLKDFKKAFINPLIVEESGGNRNYNEGCLSIPDIREDVDRNERIRIQYYDRDWNFFDEIYEGVKARIIQHEYDHLEGILFIDKINPLRRRLISSRLNAISKGRIDVDYKIKLSSR
jgi:peptide deformylase